MYAPFQALAPVSFFHLADRQYIASFHESPVIPLSLLAKEWT